MKTKHRFLTTLLMAIVMMAMSPMKMWAQFETTPLTVGGTQNITKFYSSDGMYFGLGSFTLTEGGTFTATFGEEVAMIMIIKGDMSGTVDQAMGHEYSNHLDAGSYILAPLVQSDTESISVTTSFVAGEAAALPELQVGEQTIEIPVSIADVCNYTFTPSKAANYTFHLSKADSDTRIVVSNTKEFNSGETSSYIVQAFRNGSDKFMSVSCDLEAKPYYVCIGENGGNEKLTDVTLTITDTSSGSGEGGSGDSGDSGEGEKTATVLVKNGWITPHATFVGSWTTDEINAKIKSGEYDNGDLQDDQLGLVDLTGVTLENLGKISTPNPNTIIEISQSQSISNTANVLVNGVVANLVITDPLTAAGAQDASNYSTVDCGFYYSGEEFTATKASYTRPMTSTYATVMIPFKFDSAAQNATIMDITNIDENGVEIEPTEYVEIAYGRPFIAKVTDGDLKITAENTTASGSYGGINSMFGFYTEIELGEGDYYIAQDQFWNAGSCEGDVILKPFRCYIELPEVNEVKIAIKENANGIKAVNSEQLTVNNGKFIENGKVVVVKNGEKFNVNGQRVR